jgi:tight adherence protein C
MRSLQLAAERPGKRDHPLYVEFRGLLTMLNNRTPFPQAIEWFARRCAVHEVSLFANALLLNYKRGGDELAGTLRTLNAQLWHTRKTALLTLGEEASSKLVFPMAVLFLTVMVIVAAPAFFYLN